MARKRKKKGENAITMPSMIDDNKWRARSDYQTLCDAAEISRDSGRLSGAKRHAKEQKERADRIALLDGKLL